MFVKLEAINLSNIKILIQRSLGFDSPFLSIVHGLMLMMGDWNFDGIFVQPLTGLSAPLSYPALSFFFLILFVILMPILFINLLVN